MLPMLPTNLINLTQQTAKVYNKQVYHIAQAKTHGGSQPKHQNVGVGDCAEEGWIFVRLDIGEMGATP